MSAHPATPSELHVRGTWNAFGVFLWTPGDEGPGELIGTFQTLTAAARAMTAAKAALARIERCPSAIRRAA